MSSKYFKTNTFTQKIDSGYFHKSKPMPHKNFKIYNEKAEETFYQKEKKRIESIKLDHLSFNDLYEFPLRLSKHIGWVYDNKGNFVFQFEEIGRESQEKVVKFLNSEIDSINKIDNLCFKNGVIYIDESERIDIITIRGWGNLTGIGAYNLEGEYAAKIQDTFGQYILERIQKSTNLNNE